MPCSGSMSPFMFKPSINGVFSPWPWILGFLCYVCATYLNISHIKLIRPSTWALVLLWLSHRGNIKCAIHVHLVKAHQMQHKLQLMPPPPEQSREPQHLQLMQQLPLQQAMCHALVNFVVNCFIMGTTSRDNTTQNYQLNLERKKKERKKNHTTSLVLRMMKERVVQQESLLNWQTMQKCCYSSHEVV